MRRPQGNTWGIADDSQNGRATEADTGSGTTTEKTTGTRIGTEGTGRLDGQSGIGTITEETTGTGETVGALSQRVGADGATLRNTEDAEATREARRGEAVREGQDMKNLGFRQLVTESNPVGEHEEGKKRQGDRMWATESFKTLQVRFSSQVSSNRLYRRHQKDFSQKNDRVKFAVISCNALLFFFFLSRP